MMPEHNTPFSVWWDVLAACRVYGSTSAEVADVLQQAAKTLSSEDWYFIVLKYQAKLRWDSPK